MRVASLKLNHLPGGEALNDIDIIELYFQRNEEALEETKSRRFDDIAVTAPVL